MTVLVLLSNFNFNLSERKYVERHSTNVLTILLKHARQFKISNLLRIKDIVGLLRGSVRDYKSIVRYKVWCALWQDLNRRNYYRKITDDDSSTRETEINHAQTIVIEVINIQSSICVICV